MEVDEKAAAATSEYEGKAYYLCAPGCKRAFDAAPAKYLAASLVHRGAHLKTTPEAESKIGRAHV